MCLRQVSADSPHPSPPPTLGEGVRHRRPRRTKPAPLSLILGEGLEERATQTAPTPALPQLWGRECVTDAPEERNLPPSP